MCFEWFVFQDEERSHSRQRPPRAEESERPVVKREKHDPGYERYAHASAAPGASRWEDGSEAEARAAQQRDRARNDERRRERHRDREGGRERDGPSRGARGGGAERHQWGRPEVKTEQPAQEKEKPNFGLSGKLTEETNTFRGVVIKYSEPSEARKPKRHWRFYPFKGDEGLPVLHLHRQSAFLLGRDRKVADIPVDHPSCSKQHAALQFRLVPYDRADGTKGRRVRPYIIDLGSANGTYVNNQRIEAQRYVELMEKDVVKFGYSTREYVLMHADTDTSELHNDEDDLGE